MKAVEYVFKHVSFICRVVLVTYNKNSCCKRYLQLWHHICCAECNDDHILGRFELSQKLTII